MACLTKLEVCTLSLTQNIDHDQLIVLWRRHMFHSFFRTFSTVQSLKGPQKFFLHKQQEFRQDFRQTPILQYEICTMGKIAPKHSTTSQVNYQREIKGLELFKTLEICANQGSSKKNGSVKIFKVNCTWILIMVDEEKDCTKTLSK